MLLHRIHLDPRCREARRDLADPYQLHSTLCRAFSSPDKKCPEGEFLWRLEPEIGPNGCPRILVQSRGTPDWAGICVRQWLASVDPAVDLNERLRLDSLKSGQRFRFRLRANPCVKRYGKRLGLLKLEEQEKWLVRKGGLHGFVLPSLTDFNLPQTSSGRPDVRVSQEQMLHGQRHDGNSMRIYSALFDGILTVTDPGKFRSTLEAGIGHGKVVGLGLLSVVPIT